jgi:hypothetical protein
VVPSLTALGAGVLSRCSCLFRVSFGPCLCFVWEAAGISLRSVVWAWLASRVLGMGITSCVGWRALRAKLRVAESQSAAGSRGVRLSFGS